MNGQNFILDTEMASPSPGPESSPALLGRVGTMQGGHSPSAADALHSDPLSRV